MSARALPATRNRPSYALVLAVLAVIVAVCFVASLAVGPAGIGLGSVFEALFGGVRHGIHIIIIEMRLPRAILGALIGGALGSPGRRCRASCATRWPSPASSASGRGRPGRGHRVLFRPRRGLRMACRSAPCCALSAVVAGHAAGGREAGSADPDPGRGGDQSFRRRVDPLALNLAPNPFAALEIVFWLLGSLADRSSCTRLAAAAVMLLGWALLFTRGAALDALTLGEESPRTLGVDCAGLRLRLVGGTALGVGAAVAVAG